MEICDPKTGKMKIAGVRLLCRNITLDIVHCLKYI
jgi:hypothetical protein